MDSYQDIGVWKQRNLMVSRWRDLPPIESVTALHQRRERTRLIFAKNSQHGGQIVRNKTFGWVRVCFPNGDIIYFPEQETRIDESETLWIDLIAPAWFVAMFVSSEYVVKG
jgi:hypothetical protein